MKKFVCHPKGLKVLVWLGEMVGFFENEAAARATCEMVRFLVGV